MARLTRMLSFALAACAAASSAIAQTREAEAPQTSVSRLNESMVFHAGFDDREILADLAAGSTEAIGAEGTVRFVPGRVGGALLLGSLGGGTSVRVLGFPARTGQFVIQRMGFDRARRRPDRLVVGVLDVPDVRRLYVELDGARDRDAAVWRWIAASWDPDGFEVGVDGGPLERRSLPGPFDLDVFEIDGVAALLVVGGASSETTPRDDRSLCSPALDARDIARLVAP